MRGWWPRVATTRAGSTFTGDRRIVLVFATDRLISRAVALASDLPCLRARRVPMASAERVPGDEGSERRPRRSVFVDDAAELLGVSQRHGDIGAVQMIERRSGGGNVVGEARRREDRAFLGERHHSPELVLELTHVARPSVKQQMLHCLFGDADLALLEFRDRAAEEIV